LEGAARVVGQHHERWDGTGYPLGLRGEEIDLNARIFQVADAFDAITSNRVYRSGKSYEKASEELRLNAGEQFDPLVVAAFDRIPPEEWEQLRLENASREEKPAPRRFSVETKSQGEAVRRMLAAETAQAIA
ncbi:MAG TPA: HD domain-containing phosphohydrolase, partial [Pyrinomonadaceae bacterium]